MGKAALISIAAFVVATGLYAVSTQKTLSATGKQMADYQYEVLARNAALAGQSRAKRMLAENFSSTSVKGDFEGVPYQVEAAVNGATVTLGGVTATAGVDEAVVIAVGTASGTDGQDVPYTIKTVYYREMDVEMAEKAPPHMRYAVLSDDGLNLGGNVNADIYAEGNERDTLNADMHTNGHLHAQGSVGIKGFGTYSTRVSASPESKLETQFFVPNHNPASEDHVREVDSVKVPAFDISKFLPKVHVDETWESAADLAGERDFRNGSNGTREDPYVIHVKKGLNVTDVRISGYVLFLVEEDIKLAGNVVIGESYYDGADESSVAFYTGKNASIDLTGNAKLYGQIFAGGDVTLKGTPKVYGSISAGGEVFFRGNSTIYYRTPSPALTTIWEEGKERTYLHARSEW